MKKVKFCNIKNIFETRTAARLGADYLGFHLISESDFKRIDEIRACVRELKVTYPKTKSVLVTKESDTTKLSTVLDQIEFDVVQLHYADSPPMIAQLRSIYGLRLEIIQVITADNVVLSPFANIYLLDKSFIGGTGKEIGLTEVKEYLKNINKSNILLAGGLAADNLHKYLEFNILGFDIQSGIKSTATQDNTDPTKIAKIAKLLSKKTVIPKNQIGYAIQDISQQNANTLVDATQAKVDFLHIDVTDGFVNNPTDLSITKQTIDSIRELSSHISLQVHVFAKDEDSYRNMVETLQISEAINLNKILHINRDNYGKFDVAKLKSEKLCFGLDVKDLIDELFPWEQFIQEETLICLQSTEHLDRVANFNRAQKMIKYAFNGDVSITIDRSIDLKTLSEIDEVSNISLVSGSYLKQDISQKYNLLKMYFYGRR